jgi:long-chain acyl-CoA synthetase
MTAEPPGAGPVVIAGAQRRTHEEIKGRAARAAEGFLRHGIGADAAVALLLRNDFAFLEATQAAGMAGAYPVPLNWHAAPAEWAYILRDCEARVLVAHVDLLRRIAPVLPPGLLVLAVPLSAELRGAFALTDDGEVPPCAPEWDTWCDQFDAIEAPAAAAPGAVIYTSGSTGRPKGVRRPPVPRSAGSSRALQVYGFDLPGPVRALITGPLYHSVPNAYARLAFRAGADIVLLPRFDPLPVLSAIEAEKITHMHIVPAMCTRLLRLPAAERERHDLSALRYVVHGAAPCPPAVKAAMIGWLGPIVHEYYGSTETGLLTWIDSAQAAQKPGSVGRALPGIALHILGVDGQIRGPRTIGDVYARSPTLHHFTYLGQPDQRAQVGRGDLITAGDLGWLDEDGYLFLCDRKKDVIVCGGETIYAAEIEAALLAAPAVSDCAVIGLPDPVEGEIICAFVELVAGAGTQSAALSAWLAGKLPPAKRPRRIELVSSLPREDSGKIFKQRLREIAT